MNKKLEDLSQRFVSIGTICLVGFLPLLYHRGMVDVYEQPKQFFMYIAVAILAAAQMVYVATRERSGRFVLDKLDLAVLGYLLVSLVSTIRSESLYTSLFGVTGRISASFISVVCGVVWYFIIRIRPDNSFDRLRFWQVVWGVFCLEAVFGSLQRLGVDLFGITNQAAAGTIGGSGTMSLVSILALLGGWLLFLAADKAVSKIIYSGGMLLAFSGLICANNRPMWLLLIVSLLWLGLYIIPKRKQIGSEKWVISSVLFGICAVLALVFATPWVGVGNWPQIGSIFTPEAGWDAAAQISRIHPLFGSGPETFSLVYPVFKPFSFNLNMGYTLNHVLPYNEFFSHLANLGYIGLFAYLYMIILGFRMAKNSYKSIEVENPSRLLSTMVFGVIVMALLISGGTVISNMLFWTALAMIASSSKPETLSSSKLPDKPRDPEETNQVALIAAGIGLLLSGFVFIFIVRWYLAETKIVHHLQYLEDTEAESVQAAYEDIREAAGLIPWDDRVHRLLALRTADIALQELAALQDQSVDATDDLNEQIAEILDQATDSIDEAIRLNPINASNYATAAQIALVSSNSQEVPRDAISNYEKAINYDPSNPYYYESLGVLYYQMQDYETAQYWINYAINVKYDWWVTRYDLAQILKALGENDEAKSQLEIAQQLLAGETDVSQETVQQITDEIEALTSSETVTDEAIEPEQTDSTL